MENIFFLPVALITLAILLGIAGLTFLIIGLVQNKRGFWVGGAASLTVSIIIAVIGVALIIKPIMTKVSNGISKLDLRTYHYKNDFSDQSDNYDWPVDSTFAEPVSGFIEDEENSPVYIKIFPQKKFLSDGVIIVNIGKDRKVHISQNTISMTISFEKEFKGTVCLTAYDYDKNELGISSVALDQSSGANEIVNFAFEGEINFGFVKYCTLTLK